jgi:threonine dehydrogenase-like Zn-dependent dehydrogenase
MLAAVIEGPGAVVVRETAGPRAAGLALVRVGQAGVCGTDRKLAAGVMPVTPPRVLGHEMTGWVEAAAPGGAVPAGTPVVVNPAVFCGMCPDCRADHPNLCGRGGLLGRDLDGCFAEQVAVPETLLHPLPGAITADEGALLQVLSTCVHAQSGVPVGPDSSAVVIGLGVAGLLHVQLLRARGVPAIVGVTRAAWKRDLGMASGASAVVPPEEAAEAVAAATGGRGAGLAIECAGTSATLAQAMRLAGPAATVIAFGAVPSADGLPAYEGYLKELTIRWPRASRPRDFDTAIRLCADRRLDLAPLVTGRFPLEKVTEALAASEHPEHLKIVLDVAAPPTGAA